VSSPEASTLLGTARSQILQSPVASSSTALSLSEGILQPTGRLYGPPPSPEISLPSRRMCVWYLIGPLEQLQPIMIDLYQLFVNVGCTGGQLELESPEEPGRRLDWTLTARIRGKNVLTLGVNFGVDTQVNETLFWTNFVEVSTSAICYDGWIGTRAEWKLREAQSLSLLRRYGLLPT